MKLNQYIESLLERRVLFSPLLKMGIIVGYHLVFFIVLFNEIFSYFKGLSNPFVYS